MDVKSSYYSTIGNYVLSKDNNCKKKKKIQYPEKSSLR